MSSPEQPAAEPQPYYQAVRSPTERSAGQAYFQAQEAIFTTDCDLSAYRLQVNRLWHVAVLGSPPPEQLERSLRTILAAGKPIPLPADVLSILLERRAQ